MTPLTAPGHAPCPATAPAPRRWRRLRTGLLTLAAAACIGSAAAATTAPAWWAALEDPVLNQLMQAAPGADSAAQQQLVQQYIALRVGSLRWQLAEGLAAAARNEQALWMSAPLDDPQREAALASVGQRLEVVEAHTQALAEAVQQHLSALAAGTGLSGAPLQALLTPALQQAALPATAARLPPQITSARVPQPLGALGEQARLLQQGEQWVEARRAEWKARQQREALGSGDALGTLQAYQQYVADTDQLAQASGRLALNWALWLQGGGARLASSR